MKRGVVKSYITEVYGKGSAEESKKICLDVVSELQTKLKQRQVLQKDDKAYLVHWALSCKRETGKEEGMW